MRATNTAAREVPRHNQYILFLTLLPAKWATSSDNRVWKEPNETRRAFSSYSLRDGNRAAGFEECCDPDPGGGHYRGFRRSVRWRSPHGCPLQRRTHHDVHER